MARRSQVVVERLSRPVALVSPPRPRRAFVTT